MDALRRGRNTGLVSACQLRADRASWRNWHYYAVWRSKSRGAQRNIGQVAVAHRKYVPHGYQDSERAARHHPATADLQDVKATLALNYALNQQDALKVLGHRHGIQ